MGDVPLDLMMAAEAANSYSAEASKENGRERGRRRHAMVAAAAVARIVKTSRDILPDLGPRSVGSRASEGDITRSSSELDVYNWYKEALEGYQLDERKTQPWKRRFLQNKMNGAALLAIRSDRELRDVFGVELKGVRARLMRDIEHERSNQTSTDNMATMDIRLRQFCYILFATLAMGFMLIELSQIIIPVILSFTVTAFMLPIVDALNKRPSRCCSATYPTYCVDGYLQLMPESLAKGDGRRSRCARVLRSFLLGIIPRPLATIIAVCIVLGVLSIVGIIIGKSIQQGLDNIEDYTEKADSIINATNAYMIEVGLNQSDIDKLYGQIPLTIIAVSGASTAATVMENLIIIMLFAMYLVIETGGVRQAPGYINARVYKKFLMPFNPNQPPGQRRQRLTKEHKELDKGIQKKLRENYDVFVTAFDEFDVQGDGLLSPDEFRLGLTRFVKGFFNITEINALRDALIKLHEAYRLQKQTSFRVRVQTDLSSYMYWKILFSGMTGLAMGATLAVFQVDLWGMYGAISFVLNFIPTLGGMIACMMTIPILAIDPDVDIYRAGLCFAIVVGIHLLVAAVLEPIVFGMRYQVHPVAVVISLMLWVSLWGFVGAFLSTPFLIIVTIALEGQAHPVAKGLFRAIKGKMTGELTADENKKAPKGPISKPFAPADARESTDSLGRRGRMQSTISDARELAVAADDDDEEDSNNEFEESPKSAMRSASRIDMQFGAAAELRSRSLFPVTPSPRKASSGTADSQLTAAIFMVQSVAHAERYQQVSVTATDTIITLCEKLEVEMHMTTDEALRREAEVRVDAATSKYEIAQRNLAEASEKAADLEELSTPSDSRTSLAISPSLADLEDADDTEAETASALPRSNSSKETKKEAKLKAKVEKKKGKSTREIEKAMAQIEVAGDELEAATEAQKADEVRARHTGCLVSAGVMLDHTATAPAAGLLTAGSAQGMLYICQNVEEKQQLVLKRWCFVPLPSEDTDANDEIPRWELVTITKPEPSMPYALGERFRVDQVLTGGTRGWVHLDVSSMDDRSGSGTKRFLMDNFRPRWLDQTDRTQIDLRRMFEGLWNDPTALVEFVHSNVGVREPRLWRFAPAAARGGLGSAGAFLDKSGAWPLKDQRWIVLFGSEDQATDTRWSVQEVRKAVRGGSYQPVGAPLPIVEIEPLPEGTAEGDNDEIRIVCGHPLQLCSAAPRAYALSKFAYAYYDSSDGRLADKFNRLCPTPDERKLLVELEGDARAMHAAASSSTDSEGRIPTPDRHELEFDRQRADAELTLTRSRLDGQQRQFREFLETNLHQCEQEHWVWPGRALGGSGIMTPRASGRDRQFGSFAGMTPRAGRSRGA